MTVTGRRHPLVSAALASAGIALVAAVAIAVATLTGHSSGPSTKAEVTPGARPLPTSSHPAQSIQATVVKVALTDKGGPAGQGDGAYSSRAMGVSADQTTVPHGLVSFVMTNVGSVDHEMLILPLPDSQAVGTRPSGADAKIDETGRIGEASHSEPKSSSSMTVTLAPGRYELVCNHTGHYVSGMHTQLTVS